MQFLRTYNEVVSIYYRQLLHNYFLNSNIEKTWVTAFIKKKTVLFNGCNHVGVIKIDGVEQH